ncbi:hypothetical protein [Clostridium sp.]|uniref:hypothetical protein n=1 Tax=Clostridium sp. TaxID=1506 RepID=UPI0035220D4D
MEKLLKILKATEIYITDIGTANKEVAELRMLIKALDSKKEFGINKIIKSIEKLDGNCEENKKKYNLRMLNEIYKKIYNMQTLSDEEIHIKNLYTKNDEVTRLLTCEDKSLISIISNEKHNCVTLEVLKIVAYARFGIEIKGKINRNIMVNEIKAFISQNNYYNNMEIAYNKEN